MEDLTPRPEDKFTFGLWTVGHKGNDPFGSETRPALEPTESVRRLAELGAYGVCFHDDDLLPPEADDGERERIKADFRKALDETGMKVSMATTNLFTHPVFKDGAFTANDREVRRYALQKAIRAIDVGAELGAPIYVFWGGREGVEADAAKPARDALERYREAIDFLCELRARPRLRHALRARAEAERAARRPVPADRRPHARVHRAPRAPGDGRREPGGRSRDDGRPVVPARRGAGALGREALPHRPQRPADRPLRPGLPLRRRSASRTRSSSSSCSRTPATTARATSTRGRCAWSRRRAIWDFAAGCMRTYLALKQRAASWAGDADLRAAEEAAKVPELARRDGRRLLARARRRAARREPRPRRPGRARVRPRAARPAVDRPHPGAALRRP